MATIRTRTLVLGTGVAVAVLAGGATAFAGISSGGPIDNSGVIHACYTTSATHGSHGLVLQNTGTSCASGRTAIKWNEKGPRGPQGIQGVQGVQGPPGVVSGYVAYGGTVSLPDSFTTVDTLNLPSGDFMLSATVTVYDTSLSGQTYIPCELIDGGGTSDAIAFTSLKPGSLGGDQQAVSLTAPTTNGGTINLDCFSGEITVNATDSVITAIPLNAVSGAPSQHLQHLPNPESGSVAVPQHG